MKHFGTFEAKNRFGALLDMVEAGEELEIARNGKPVAKLVPIRTAHDAGKARAAAAAIRELRKSVKPGPDGLTVRDYVEMGRRY